ncbi:MAG: TlpA disulfide reductase family protein, partial [Bacteroidota bacterium]
KVTGTFLTTTGDYRYLEGIVDGQQLKLSTFDGEHAFLFVGKVDEAGQLNGDFWSGEHWHETFTATRDEEFQLPDASSLTYLKEGYDGIEFSFPGLDGTPVSLDDPKYQNKIVLLQIFGTWCPNCMDETQFLTGWYPEVAGQVEILGMAYERKDDFDYAVSRIQKVKERLGVPYDFVVAGTSDKEEASKTLPMLNKIISFPTLIVLDREHNIRRIHTGFSGPGTGVHYTEFVEEFKLFMQKLLNETSDLAS